MKRIILSIVLILSVISISAQKSNVSKAKSKATAEQGDFKAAREFIKPALTDPSTKDDANTWYVAGLIGETENNFLLKLALTGLSFDKNAKGQAILESINYYLKADELGQLPDEKGKVKNKFRKNIQAAIKGYYVESENLIRYGAVLYEDKNYKAAYDAFKLYLNIPSLPIMEGIALPQDSLYSEIQYFAALAASNAEMPQEAIALYKKSIAENYNTLNCYQLLYNEYFNLKDTVSYVQILKNGFEAFPKEPWFSLTLINHYIYSNQGEKALTYLDEAIANEPTSAEYYFVKGRLEEKLLDTDAANANYNKAIELDPKLAEAYAGKGRILFNKGVEVQNKADDIRDNKLYNAEIAKSEEIIRQALPLFLEAEKLDDSDVEYKYALKQIYYRLKMNDKYDETDKKLKELEAAAAKAPEATPAQ